MSMTLTFMGAARTVTGSKHLLDAGGHRVLIDCGLFQGLKDLRERNWAALPVRANSIEAVILTHIQEEDAERANRRRYTKHSPALPLFTEADASRAMAMLQPVGYDRPVPVVPGITTEFINAGHLLGSAYARVVVGEAGKTILFGGDLGRYSRPVLPDPKAVERG